MTAWLLTWLWQGVASAVFLSIALHLMPRINASTRYLLWWGAFAALIFLGLAGWGAPTAPTDAGAAGMTLPVRPFLAIEVQPVPAWLLSALWTVWGCGALFGMLRILPGLNALFRMKDQCSPFPAAVEQMLPLWLNARGRRARLVLCDELPGAALLGFHAPYIAVPSSLVSDLTPAELDQVILHEYGHVQRRDDWMRLIQAILEAALWIHPAAFLISRELNFEREVACDDWVIERTPPRSYARCLTRVAERQRRRVTPAFVQPLFGGHRDLCRRVERLLNTRRNTRRRASLPMASTGALLIAIGAAHLRAVPLIAEASPLLASSAVGISSRALLPSPVLPVALGEFRRADAPAPLEPTIAPKVDRIATSRVASASRAVRGAPAFTQTNLSGQNVQDAPEPAVLPVTSAFQGVYDAPGSQPVSKPQPAPWQAATDAALGLGAVSRSAGVTLANRFTKLGTAVARRF